MLRRVDAADRARGAGDAAAQVMLRGWMLRRGPAAGVGNCSPGPRGVGCCRPDPRSFVADYHFSAVEWSFAPTESGSRISMVPNYHFSAVKQSFGPTEISARAPRTLSALSRHLWSAFGPGVTTSDDRTERPMSLGEAAATWMPRAALYGMDASGNWTPRGCRGPRHTAGCRRRPPRGRNTTEDVTSATWPAVTRARSWSHEGTRRHIQRHSRAAIDSSR